MLLTDHDGLLAEFSKELDYFVFTRDHLQPVMTQLVRALERALAIPADAIAVGETLHLRAEYVERLGAVKPLLEEWARIGGSAAELWDAETALSPAQMARFQALLARETALAPGRATFDSLQDHLRRQLVRFAALDA
ncbi:MAG: hypothetical protein ABIP13_11320 [Tepidiformaceae bacterium]